MYLQKYTHKKWVDDDTVDLEMGKFQFTGTVKLPEMHQINVESRKVVLPIFLDASDIDVEIFLDIVDKSIVIGSKAHELYKNYLRL